MDMDEIDESVKELLKDAQWLEGNWKGGWALDLHSIKPPEGSFLTQRTTIGELLYWIKYRYHELSASHPDLTLEIVESLAKKAKLLLQTLRLCCYLEDLDAIVPVPPSQNRPFQPVEAIAVQLGELVNLPVATDYLIKVKETPALKNLDDPLEREKLLEGAFKVKDQRFKDKVVLVFDDIYRSGQTLTEITRVLYKEGRVKPFMF